MYLDGVALYNFDYRVLRSCFVWGYLVTDNEVLLQFVGLILQEEWL